MALSVGNGLDLLKSALNNAQIQNLASDPSSPVTGQIYYNTTDSVLKVYNGATWLDLAVSTGSSTISGVTGTNGVTASETGGVVTVQHADTSTVSNTANTSNTVLQNLTFDDFGHIQTTSSVAITLAGLGFSGATDADNYNGFSISGNTGTSSNIGSADTVSIIGDGVNTSVSLKEVTISNTDKGSSQNIFKTLSGDTGTAAADSNSDAINFEGGDGVISTVTDTTGNANVKIDVDSTVVRTSGEQTISGNKTFLNNVTVDGNLTVSGDTTTTVSETVNVEDSIMYLNSNAPDTPVDDGGFIVNRGLESNTGFIWDESLDRFSAINTASDASSGGNIPIDSYVDVQGKIGYFDSLSLSDVTTGTADYDAFLALDGVSLKTRTGAQLRQDIGAGTVSSVAVSTTAPLVSTGSPITGSGTINLSVSSASTDAEGVIELATDTEAKAFSSTSVVLTPSNLSAISHKQNIGDGASTSYAVEHLLDTRDVRVEIYDNSTFETVITDVVRNTVNEVTITFNTAPSLNQYRVLVTKV